MRAVTPPHPDCTGRCFASPRQSDLSPQAGRGKWKSCVDSTQPHHALAPPSKAQPQIGRSELSEAEAQSDRGSDVVALEKTEGQSVLHLREHEPGIDIPLWRKPPIDSGRDRVERPGALRVLGAEAGAGPPAGVPKKEFWI